MNEEESERKAKEVSKGGRVVQGGRVRYCSLRRRGFEPHPLHFIKETQGRISQKEVEKRRKEKARKEGNLKRMRIRKEMKNKDVKAS